jgi:hypothetical protein
MEERISVMITLVQNRYSKVESVIPDLIRDLTKWDHGMRS